MKGKCWKFGKEKLRELKRDNRSNLNDSPLKRVPEAVILRPLNECCIEKKKPNETCRNWDKTWHVIHS